MSAKKMTKRMALMVAAVAVAAMVGSTAGAVGFTDPGASGVASLFDNGTFRLELGAVTGSGNNPAVCVKVTNKTTSRRAEGCGNVSMFVHPTLDMAAVNGTIQGAVVDTRTGRTVRQNAPIAINLTYQGIGIYTPIVMAPQTNLWLYPLDVAAAQGAGIGRAAWGWGSVTAPVCQKAKTTGSGRARAKASATDVNCGPASDTPAFAGTIAQMVTAGVSTAGN